MTDNSFKPNPFGESGQFRRQAMTQDAMLSKRRVYSPGQAAAGAFLGGPLASTIFLRHNFTVLGEPNKARMVSIIGTIIVLAMIGALPFLPAKFPNMAIPIVSTVATRFAVEKNQFTKQAIASSEFLTFESNWRVIGVGLACLGLTSALILAVLLGLEHFDIVKIT